MSWISVEDRLPDEGKFYFTYCAESGGVGVLEYIGNYFSDPEDNVYPVTHYMELPNPPTGESG